MIPPHLNGFYKLVMDALSLLDVFVRKVVEGRKASWVQAWSFWIRGVPLSHPYKCPRPDFVPPAPCSGLKTRRFAQRLRDPGSACLC